MRPLKFRFVALMTTSPSSSSPVPRPMQGPQLLSKMVSRAVRADAGLLFVHSHPNPRHPTAFSVVDQQALKRIDK